MKRSERSSGRRGASARRAPPLGGVVIVAASGGADSAAALLWARAAAPGAHIVACHVDHALRPRASRARDLAAVMAQARAVRAAIEVVRLRAVSAPGVSLEARARELRYAALAGVARAHGARYVVLGHHAGDLAESVLLGMMRGSGLDGLAAMRRVRPIGEGVYLLRPLLGAAKPALRARVDAAGMPVSHDETNDDPSLRRNAVRALVAGLERVAPGAARAMARSARLLRDDARLMRGLAQRALAGARLADGSLAAQVLRGLPATLASHVLRRAVFERTGSLGDVSFVRIRALLRAVREGRGGRYALRADTWAHVSRGRVRIGPDAGASPAAASPASRIIRVPASRRRWSTPLGELEMERAGEGRARAPGDVMVSVAPGTRLELRAARPADACVPSGRRRSISLARFLSKSGVPRWERGRAAVLCDGGRIIVVLGVRAMQPSAATGAERSYIVRWRPIMEVS